MNTSSNNQRAYFDVAANRYSTPVNPPLVQRLEMEHLERALGKIPGKTIVDFGAGSGRVTFWFLKKGFNVIAVDVSKQSLTDLYTLYTTHKTSSWGKLNTSTVLPKTKVDAVVGADILHHVDIKEYLPKLYRILKPGGSIAFSEPNAWFLPWYAYILIRKLPWSIERGILRMTAYRITQGLAKAEFHHIRIHGFPKFVWFRLIVSAQKTALLRLRAVLIHPYNLQKNAAGTIG